MLSRFKYQQRIQANNEDFHAKNCHAPWQKLLLHALQCKIFLPRGKEITFFKPIVVQGFRHDFLYRKMWVRRKEHQVHEKTLFMVPQISWAGSHGTIPISKGIAVRMYAYRILVLNGIYKSLFKSKYFINFCIIFKVVFIIYCFYNMNTDTHLASPMWGRKMVQTTFLIKKSTVKYLGKKKSAPNAVVIIIQGPSVV